MKKALKSLVCLALALVLTMGFASAEKLIVGTNAEFPPFEYIDDNGEFAGFDMDLIRAILDSLEVECEIQTMDFDSLLSTLASGKIDLTIAAMTIREDRLENALFSDPYFQATQKILILATNDEIKGEADLAGKKVGVQLGTTGDLYMSDIGTEPERYTKAIDAVIDLTNGRLDAVVVDEGVSAFFAESFEGLKILDDNLSDEQYGIAMALGEEEAMALINKGLAAIRENGVYDEIYKLYFGEIATAEEPAETAAPKA